MPDARFDLVESYETAPQSDWFHSCRVAGKPYVVVRTGEKTADVMWDYVTLPPSYDAILMDKDNEKFLKEQAIAIFEKHASVESSVRVKSTVVFFDNLSIPHAKAAANELYGLIEALVENPVQAKDAFARPVGQPVGQPVSRPAGDPAAIRRPAASQAVAYDRPADALVRFELIPTA